MMKILVLLTAFMCLNSSMAQEQTDYIECSRELLFNIKNGESISTQIDVLSTSSLEELTSQLKSDTQKKAFWINVYNAYVQKILMEQPDLFKPENRSQFFSEPRIKIAGELLSFDDIEHGVIRKSRIKWSLGYLKKWFNPKWERKLRVDKVDWRIHFALNCGAISCPPIAIYSAEKLDEELDLMATAYLKEHSTYYEATQTVKTTALMSWFRGDFGGKNGAKEILQSYGITSEVPETIEFKSYDWTLSLGNYRAL
jgi:hypothetical protein